MFPNHFRARDSRDRNASEVQRLKMLAYHAWMSCGGNEAATVSLPKATDPMAFRRTYTLTPVQRFRLSRAPPHLRRKSWQQCRSTPLKQQNARALYYDAATYVFRRRNRPLYCHCAYSAKSRNIPSARTLGSVSRRQLIATPGHWVS